MQESACCFASLGRKRGVMAWLLLLIAGAMLLAANPARATEFTVNSPGNGGVRPRIAALAGGGFVITWQGNGIGLPANPTAVLAQRFDANGVKQGAEFTISTTTSDSPFRPDIAGLKDGGFVIAWAGKIIDSSAPGGLRYGVWAQRFDANGVKQGPELQVSALLDRFAKSSPSVAGLEDGGFVIIFEDEAPPPRFPPPHPSHSRPAL